MLPEDEDDESLEDVKRLDRFFDGEEQTTLYFELEKRGWAPDLSEDLSDDELTQALTNLLWSMKDLGHFVEDVDHLPDRELYAELLEYCDEPTVCFPGIVNGGMHWSPIGGGTEDDNQVWLRYYASEDDRARHAKEYPSDPIPPSEPIPYPRPWMPKVRFEFERTLEDEE
jgi:hypothetical protein